MPYGELLDPPANPMESILFTGKQKDNESGLDYFSARYLDCEVGRWYSADPVFLISGYIINPQGWNQYSYVLSNPLNFSDPTGMIVQGEDAAAQKKVDDYVKTLDKSSDAYKTYQNLQASPVLFVVHFLDSKSGTGEGKIDTQDGKTIDVDIVFAGPSDKMSVEGKLTHEFEHGRQYLGGEVGFVSDQNGAIGSWHAAFYDGTDEKKAYEAQLKVAPQDRRAKIIQNMESSRGVISLEKLATAFGKDRNWTTPKNVPPSSLPKGQQSIASYKAVNGVSLEKFQNWKYSVVPK